MKKQNGKFQYLYDDLRTKIENHIFMPEDKLPSETQLIEQYGISRYMVRQVLEKLTGIKEKDVSSVLPLIRCLPLLLPSKYCWLLPGLKTFTF